MTYLDPVKRVNSKGELVSRNVSVDVSASIPRNLGITKRDHIIALLTFACEQIDERSRVIDLYELEIHGLWGKRPDDLLSEPDEVIAGLIRGLQACEDDDFYGKEFIAGNVYALTQATYYLLERRRITATYMPILMEYSRSWECSDTLLNNIDTAIVDSHSQPLQGMHPDRQAAARTILKLMGVSKGQMAYIQADAVALESLFVEENRRKAEAHFDAIADRKLLDFDLIAESESESTFPLSIGSL